MKVNLINQFYTSIILRLIKTYESKKIYLFIDNHKEVPVIVVGNKPYRM